MKHYLVIANRTLGGPLVREAIETQMTAGKCHFHVVVPATRPQGLLEQSIDAVEGVTPGGPEATERAEARLSTELAWIKGLGAEASGEIGDDDPITLVRRVLDERHIDGIILSTIPASVSKWFALDLPSRLAREFDIPLTTVIEPRYEVE